ncbi:hypothetical protein EYB53_021340 [Candidatus Chloroploca sp. M-50]|uniref:Uncharacterized protein n=2 Tax=Candidatus Chloroploca TaxID=1579476 RepID=A0A2H3L6K9_9CHLR|nr:MULTISPECIES: hypothetical protein [Candidatus Chloroploca]MBP1468269.1 hypothetical protein [Candidatus Chloroploca mongolica]PDV97904.1 hypothetical protein A9Q02_16905 [Candidatus Chloroploca asiatica]
MVLIVGASGTLVRPTAFLATHAYGLIGKPQIEQGKVTIFGRGTGRRNVVAVQDIAQLISITRSPANGS